MQALVIEAVDEGIEPRLLLQRWPQRAWSPRSSASGASARIPFEPKGRLAQILKRRRFLGPKAYVFGGASGEYQGTIRTAWESLVLLANGIEPTMDESIATSSQRSIFTGTTSGIMPSPRLCRPRLNRGRQAWRIPRLAAGVARHNHSASRKASSWSLGR
ncbi:MAG TPA: hypothetical protein VGQ29_13250 [Gemmatimonadales bacterium]|nr:hypothetical protein [Gemmatimonadales bacterium]